MTDAVVRTSGSVVVRPAPDTAGIGLSFENFRVGDTYAANEPAALAVLERASEPTDLDALQSFLTDEYDMTAESAESLLSTLREQSILVPAEREPLHSAAESWFEYNWADALELHLTARNEPPPNRPSGRSGPDGRSVDAADRLSLPEPSVPARRSLDDAITFGDAGGQARADETSLAALLQFALGDHGGDVPPTALAGILTRPSTGYVVVGDVADVPAGLYRYDSVDHALERLRAGEHLDDFEGIAYELADGPDFEPAFVVVFTCSLARLRKHYPSAHAYRLALYEVGERVERVRTLAGLAGLPAYFGHGFDDDQMESFLGIEAEIEPPFRFAAVGGVS